MADARPSVLIIGGSGVFGAHLCRRLARLGLYIISVGGRNRDKALSLLQELMMIDPGCEARFVPTDRNTVTAEELKWHGLAAVVDAAGPFQGSPLRLAEAAIEAGIHYIDLSDARDFVARIPSLDAKAKAAAVAVLTGASSTPALSHAMVHDLTTGWRSIDRIWVSIVPGSWSNLKLRPPNAPAEPGRSVIESILSWAGEPVRVFDDGRWQTQMGWSGHRKVRLGHFGWRRSSLAETPDLDLLAEEFRPRLSARFHAGLELSVMHNGLRLLALLRHWRLLPRLTVFTTALHLCAQGISIYGTKIGGMVVEAEGIDGDGAGMRAEALLTARDGHGPVIPALCAVALLKQIAEGSLDFRGASHAGRHLQTRDVLALVPDLSIRLNSDCRKRGIALFAHVLGSSFNIMPGATRTLHRGTPAILGEGHADIDAPGNFMGRIISALFRFPKPGRNVPVSVLVEQTPTGERWLRRYPGREMLSFMCHGDPETRTLEERFGPFTFRMKITGHADGLDIHMVSARMGPLQLPRFLVPDITATERVGDQGRHLFDVSIHLPFVGKIVRYTGWLILR
jgi:NAD(P)-dependent dehydrogenase (short-subunit alcohol dehydrogenase family)